MKKMRSLIFTTQLSQFPFKKFHRGLTLDSSISTESRFMLHAHNALLCALYDLLFKALCIQISEVMPSLPLWLWVII
jgi:hypothetical protein